MDTPSWDPDRYARHARFVSDLGAPLIELLAPKPGERILDLGCGDGALTEKLVALGCRVVGVDRSPEQIAAARRRGLEAYVMDGERLTFSTEFDAVFSNAALHWMRGPDAVIDGVWRALVPGGRFAAECGGRGNIAKVEGALLRALGRRGIDGAQANPWYFPDPEDYARRLTARGFAVTFMSFFPRPTALPGDIGDWLETFAQTFLALVSPGERSTFVDEVREALRPDLCDRESRWAVDYVRLRIAAVKPSGSAPAGASRPS